MRLTNLGWRNPQEVTAEFRCAPSITKEGLDLNYLKNRSSTTRRQTFPQEKRWKQYGTAFTGPGSYYPEDNFKRSTNAPCMAVMKKISILEPNESKRGCYVMFGDQIKFDPSLSNPKQKKIFNET